MVAASATMIFCERAAHVRRAPKLRRPKDEPKFNAERRDEVRGERRAAREGPHKPLR